MKYNMRILQIHIVDHCNFRCEHCSHGSPFAPKRFFSWHEDYKHSVSMLSKYATVGGWDLMGGEPFLDFDKLLSMVNGINSSDMKAPINVATNGFWLNQYKNFEELFSKISHLDFTYHPESKISLNHMRSYSKLIKSEYNLRSKVEAPSKFSKISFVDDPIQRTYCKFCPQLLANGTLAKCQIIGYEKFHSHAPESFKSRSDQGRFDISNGDFGSLKKWYETNGTGLHEACNHCRYMVNPADWVEHRRLEHTREMLK